MIRVILIFCVWSTPFLFAQTQPSTPAPTPQTAAPQPLTQSSFLPKNLGANINTTYDEINPVISPDGKTLFFTRVNHPENFYGEYDSEDIWYSELQPNGEWSVAKRLENLNLARYNSVLSISQEGKTLLLNGIFNKKGNFFRKRGLSFSYLTDQGWSPPSRVYVQGLSRINRGAKSNTTLSFDGEYMILSLSKKYNSEKTDLFVTAKINDSYWTKPKRIKSLKTKYNEDAPFLSSDNRVLYFSSNRSGNYNIYKTKRISEEWDTWTMPVQLSDTINSTAWESYFKTNEKGSWAYFSSTAKTMGNSDLYKVKLFEENPYVVINGLVINRNTNKPLKKGVTYTIFANNTPADSVKINPDSSNYKVTLPLGARYKIVAKIPNYISKEEIIDVSNEEEFTAIKKDLKVEPLPYVLVRGKALVNNTFDLIPQSARPKIAIDRVPIDSIRIDPNTGDYSVRLPHGKAYRLQVSATRMEPVPSLLDLTYVDEYQELVVNLFAEKEKLVIVSGRIIDKKTGSVLAPRSKIQIDVVGAAASAMIARLDSLTNQYELNLPPNASYMIGANAPGYYPVSEALELANQGGTRVYKDLYLVPEELSQMATMSGRVMNKKTEQPFPPMAQIQVGVTGSTTMVAKIDSLTARYELKLPLGANYTIGARAPKFYPVYETVDLVAEKNNINIEKDLYLVPVEVGQSIRLNNIFFQSGKAILKPESFSELNRVVEFMAGSPTIKIEISGHTDNVGSDVLNLNLSNARAKAVADYLIRKGIASDRIQSKGYGMTKPVASNATADGRAQNRRVEFVILDD